MKPELRESHIPQQAPVANAGGLRNTSFPARLVESHASGRFPASWTTLAILFVAIQSALILLLQGKSLLVAAGLLYLWALFLYPHLAIVVALVVIFDGLGFINPETSWRVPGLLKAKDVFFVSLFLPLLTRRWRERAHAVVRRNKTLFLPAGAILLMMAFQMVRTSLQFDLPLKSCIMAGRHYLYYALVFPAAIYLDSSKKQHLVYHLFLLVIAALAAIVIVQTLVLVAGGNFFLTGNIQIRNRWGPLNVPRIYPPGVPAIVLMFALTLWGIFLRSPAKARIGYLAGALLCGLAIFLLDSRMTWLYALLITIIPVLFMRRMIPGSGRKLFFALLLVTVGIVSLAGLLGSESRIVSGGLARLASGFSEIKDKSGTWQYRLDDSRFRFDLMRERPLLGVGFVHINYAHRFGARGLSDDPAVIPDQGVTTTDSGLVAILVDFGIAGLLWSFWYLVAILASGRRIFSTSGRQLNWVALPIMAFMLAGALTSVTLTLFTSAWFIATQSFAVGMLASLEKADVPETGRAAHVR